MVGWTCVCLLSISNRPAHRTQRVHEPLPHGCCVLGRTRGIVVNTPGCLQGMRRCDLAQHRHSRFPRNIPEVHRDPIESPDPTPPTPRCARWSEGREFGAPKEGTSKKSSRNRHRCARGSSLFPADLSLAFCAFEVAFCQETPQMPHDDARLRPPRNRSNARHRSIRHDATPVTYDVQSDLQTFPPKPSPDERRRLDPRSPGL